MQDAQGRKAPVERVTDRVAGMFTWGVIAAAGATAVVWGLGGPLFYAPLVGAAGGGAAAWVLGLQLATSVSIVSCPCALGLATPTAVLVGTTSAVRKGLLLRGGDVVEQMDGLGAVVFDKVRACVRACVCVCVWCVCLCVFVCLCAQASRSDCSASNPVFALLVLSLSGVRCGMPCPHKCMHGYTCMAGDDTRRGPLQMDDQ